METKSTHLISILGKLLTGIKLSSIDVMASNSNQYFCTIKNQGIELIEAKKPNLLNRGYHLERRLNLTDDNIQKANDYLNKLKGII